MLKVKFTFNIRIFPPFSLDIPLQGRDVSTCIRVYIVLVLKYKILMVLGLNDIFINVCLYIFCLLFCLGK
jgi:hypothetical protein